MNRRKFLSWLGIAPVAAVVPSVPVNHYLPEDYARALIAVMRAAVDPPMIVIQEPLPISCFAGGMIFWDK